MELEIAQDYMDIGKTEAFCNYLQKKFDHKEKVVNVEFAGFEASTLLAIYRYWVGKNNEFYVCHISDEEIYALEV